MKRLICLVLVLLCLTSVSFAEEENRYLDIAGELAKCVGILAKDTGYQSLVAAPHFEGLEEMAQADFETVISAYSIKIPEMKLFRFLLGISEEETMEDFSWEYMCSQAPMSVLNIYIGRLGAEALAMSSMLRYARTYEMPEGFEPCIILLEMDGAMVGTGFAKTGENTITASAVPFLSSEDAGEIAEQLLGNVFPLNIKKIR